METIKSAITVLAILALLAVAAFIAQAERSGGMKKFAVACAAQGGVATYTLPKSSEDFICVRKDAIVDVRP
jgi:hypothetical protein